jgi:hypothetical protein
MAYPSIGSESFLSLRGALRGLRETLEVLERENVDGQGYRERGQRGPIFQLFSVVDVGSAGAARNKILTYEDMVGTVVTVTDVGGAAWTGYMVLDAQNAGIAERHCIVGGVNVSTGGSGFYVACAWLLQATAAQTPGSEATES